MTSVDDHTRIALPSFSVAVAGTALPVDVAARVSTVTVEESIDRPTMFSIELGAPLDPAQESGWLDDALFDIGGTVKIDLGYVDAMQTLLEGEITGLEPIFSRAALPLLTVRGYDRSHRLHRQRKTRTFVEQKDSDIAAGIGQAAGLTVQATDSQVVHPYMLQAGQTDFEFLSTRARCIGYELVIEGKTLYFRPVANADGEIATLTLDEDLIELYPRLSTLRQFSELEARGWDPKKKEAIVAQAKSGSEVSTMGGSKSASALVENAFGAAAALVGDRPVSTQAEADQLVRGSFNTVALQLIAGDGIARGRTDLRAGKVIKIDGLGRRFGGNYYVTATTHRYSPEHAYQTHFVIRRNAS